MIIANFTSFAERRFGLFIISIEIINKPKICLSTIKLILIIGRANLSWLV